MTSTSSAAVPPAPHPAIAVELSSSAPSDGSTITIADTLPSGLSLGAEEASGQDQLANALTLARMKMEIDAARLLVWRASWMGRNGVAFKNAEGSMSKLKSGEVAVWVTERAIQILGGNGYTREFPVELSNYTSKRVRFLALRPTSIEHQDA
jgi:hypothetical protein